MLDKATVIKDVVHTQRKLEGQEIIEIKSTLEFTRTSLATVQAVKESKGDAIKHVERENAELLFREVFGVRRERFYELCNEIRYLCSSIVYPPISDALNKLKALVD